MSEDRRYGGLVMRQGSAQPVPSLLRGLVPRLQAWLPMRWPPLVASVSCHVGAAALRHQAQRHAGNLMSGRT